MFKVKIPIKTVSEANLQGHWSKRHKRAKTQKRWVKYVLGNAIKNESPEFLKMRPLTITLIRIAPRKLDGDNLQTSLKACRDQVADILNPGLMPGRADDDPAITWEYDQRKGIAKEYAVEVSIEGI